MISKLSHKYSSSLGYQIPLIMLCVIALFPTYFMIVTALKTTDEYAINILGLPVTPTLINFVRILSGKDFFNWMKNSIVLTASSTFLSLVLGSFAAFSFSRMKFTGKAGIYFLLISLMVFPPIIIIIPLFVFMAGIKLINTNGVAILIYVATLLPFTIFLLTQFFAAVQQELLDAAYIDGCSSLSVLRYILVPLSRPALITVGIVNALYVWNELLVVLVFLQSDKLKTLMVGVSLISSRRLDVPLIMAGLVLIVLPIVALYIVGQQFFIQGLTAGSLKE